MTAFYQFGSVAFAPLVPDGLHALPSGLLNFSERHVPYSDLNILDLGGKSAQHYAKRIRLATANYSSFAALFGTSATLYLASVSHSGATLVVLTNVEGTPFGEYILCDVDFVL